MWNKTCLIKSSQTKSEYLKEKRNHALFWKDSLRYSALKIISEIQKFYKVSTKNFPTLNQNNKLHTQPTKLTALVSRTAHSGKQSISHKKLFYPTVAEEPRTISPNSRG